VAWQLNVGQLFGDLAMVAARRQLKRCVKTLPVWGVAHVGGPYESGLRLAG